MDTRYSGSIAGEQSNYDWNVEFDMTDKHLGITQYHPDEYPGGERVLLSPKQVRALKRFLENK